MRRALFILPFLLFACKILTFPLDYTTTSRVDGAGLLGSVLGAVDFTGLSAFDVALDDELSNQGAAPGDVTRVTLTGFNLSSGPDLSFFETVNVYVEADGFPRTLVASCDSFPVGEETVAFDLANVNLVDAITAPSLTWSVEADGQAPADDHDITIALSVEIEATLQGACKALSGDGSD